MRRLTSPRQTVTRQFDLDKVLLIVIVVNVNNGLWLRAPRIRQGLFKLIRVKAYRKCQLLLLCAPERKRRKKKNSEAYCRL
jgi:hypothetical protein